MMKVQFIIFLLIFELGQVQAQKDTSKYNPTKVELNGNYLKSFYYDSKSIAVAPFHWSKKQWLTFGGVTTTATGLYIVADQKLQKWSQSMRSHGTEQISVGLEIFGNGKFPLITTGTLYLYGAAFKKPKARRTALLVLNSYLITGAAAQFTKMMTGRHRPWDNPNYDVWDGPSLDRKNMSFFSGHATTVWACATVFTMEYRDKKWVAPVAYGIAGLSSLSRVHDNAHWVSDIFVGSAVGYFLTKTIVRNHRNDNGGLSILPTINSKGLVLNYTF